VGLDDAGVHGGGEAEVVGMEDDLHRGAQL